jgi:hypothetical protein
MFVQCEDCDWMFNCDHHQTVLDAAYAHEHHHPTHTVRI